MGGGGFWNSLILRLINSMIELLHMLSFPGCQVRAVHWLYWNSHAWKSSNVNLMLK